ncbi:MAG: metal ABC transporter permease [Phycisphaerales bacterium]|nr:metal ABC transporter permease [Phycisphaerales bacterium]
MPRDAAIFALPFVGELFAYDLWVIATASLVGALCGVLGCYLLLRRLSMLGDAISHAILPGLAGAFLLSGSRSLAWMLLGAGVVGVLTGLLTAGLHRVAKIAEDASMGVVFTTLFALGVLLISFAARDVDLDPGCVLYGLLEFTPLDTVSLWGLELPRATASLAAAALVVAGVLAVMHKEIKLVAFDPALAAALGMRPTLVHFVMVALIAGVSVVSFESVGSILVVALLVTPAATAHLLTDRYARMMILAASIGALSGAGGYLLAKHIETWKVDGATLGTSTAGCVSVVCALMFLAAAAFSPRHGVLSRIARQLALKLRICREDILGMLYRAAELRSRGLSRSELTQGVGSTWLVDLALVLLRRRGLVLIQDATVRLTEQGHAEARQFVGTHRLWESFLTARLGLPPDHVHAATDRAEHFIAPDIRDKLAQDVRTTQPTESPLTDPHGRQIPGP